MASTYLLSDESKHYLCCYYQILDEMIQGITTAKLTQSISHNFIVQMIPQLQAAVRMSRNILEASDSTAVRRLAQRIIDRQAQEIEQLEGELPAAGELTSPRPDLRLYHRRMDLISREMFTRLGAAPEGNRLDAVYLQQLIPHRQGAVRMARHALRYDLSTGLPPILRSIADTQCREIGQIRSLLRRMGCQAT